MNNFFSFISLANHLIEFISNKQLFFVTNLERNLFPKNKMFKVFTEFFFLNKIKFFSLKHFFPFLSIFQLLILLIVAIVLCYVNANPILPGDDIVYKNPGDIWRLNENDALTAPQYRQYFV